MTIAAVPKFNPFREAIPFLYTGTDADHEGDIRPTAYHINGAIYAAGSYTSRAPLCGQAMRYVIHQMWPFRYELDWLMHNHRQAAAHIKRYMNRPNVGADEVIQDWRRSWLEHLANLYDRGEIVLK